MTWMNIRARCETPSHPSYRNYGAIGITLCERWHTFANFLADMGQRPDGHSLDRIDNNGPYEPGNCRWANVITQANNKRTNVRRELNGSMMTLAQIARLMRVDYGALRRRIVKEGQSADAAVHALLHGRKRKVIL